jgi:hypothetical protein
MSKTFMLYPDLQGLKWAIGAKLEVRVSWPDRSDCQGGLLATPICPPVSVNISSVNALAWRSTPLAGIAAVAVVDVEAVGTGDGGFEVKANGQRFNPAFVLRAEPGATIWCERASGPRYADVIPGDISELHVSPGRDAAVAVTLRSPSGEHLCGPVPAVVTTGGTVFSLETLGDAYYVNLPYHIIASSAPGQGSVQFAVGNVSRTLSIIVGP